MPLEKCDISEISAPAIGNKYDVAVNYKEAQAFLQVTLMDEAGISGLLSQEDVYAELVLRDGSTSFAVKNGGDVFNSSDVIIYNTTDSEKNTLYYMVKPTNDLLVKAEDGTTPFDNTTRTVTSTQYRFKDTKINSTLDLCVYNEEDIQSYSADNIAIPVSSVNEIPNITISIYTSLSEGFTNSPRMFNVNLTELSAELSGVDFTQTQRIEKTCTYNGKQLFLSLQLYDKSVNNIKYCSVYGYDNIVIPKDATASQVDEIVKNAIVGKKMQISYFEPIAGVSGKEIVVTEDMVNTSGINSANLGMQDALVVYTGSASEGSNATYTYTIEVLVKADLTGHNIEGSYTLIEPLQEMYSFQGIDAYDNGIAQKYTLDSEGKKQLLGQCCYEIVRESSSDGSAVIKVTDGECKLFFSIAPENQIVPLVFSGETKTYTSSSEAFGTATTAKSGTFAVGEKTYKVVSWWHGTDTTDFPFATFELAEDNTFAFASDGRVFMRGRLVEEGNVLVIEEVQ